MPYLVRTKKDQLLLLHHTTKNGLYSQILSSTGVSRPLTIHRNHTSEYSATIDHNQHLHIITQPSNEQVMHLHYEENNVTREVILEDPKNIYHFANIHVTYSDNHVHLFYTANQPIGNSCELIHHILCQENKIETHPIVRFTSSELGYRCMSHQGMIYILYKDVNTHYSLQLLIYKDNNWSAPQPVSLSSFPIDDFQFCIDHNGIIHLVYVQEKYGRYYIIYKKFDTNVWSNEVIVHTSSTKVYPAIFVYYRGIWINFVDNDGLQMILSMDQGNKFSSSVRCSLQGPDIHRCNFVYNPTLSSPHFNCTMLYAMLNPSIRIGTLSHIDMIGMHPDITPNTELELFLDGMFYSLRSPAPRTNEGSQYEQLQAENEELKKIQQQMIQQYNSMAELTKRIQDEGKKWRSKALTLESKIKDYQRTLTSPENVKTIQEQ